MNSNDLNTTPKDTADWAIQAGGSLVIWDESSSPVRIKGLNVSDKNLTGTLDVTGLTSLTALSCENNQLTALKGLDSLAELSCLICHNNKLTSLDVSGLTNLTVLTCSGNPLVSLKLQGGRELTVGHAQGGAVMLTDYTHSNKSVTLKATAQNGYRFVKWIKRGLIETEISDNPVTFTLHDQVTITPVYAIRRPPKKCY